MFIFTNSERPELRKAGAVLSIGYETSILKYLTTLCRELYDNVFPPKKARASACVLFSETTGSSFFWEDSRLRLEVEKKGSQGQQGDQNSSRP
jgi:hypothetical protein